MSTPIITLKNVKYAAHASQETHCFQATVYVNGKKFCVVSNEGHGGCDSHDAKSDDVFNLMKQINPNVVKTHDEVDRDANADWPYPDNWVETFSMTAESCFESYVANLVNVFLVEKDIKNDLRHRFVCLDDEGSIHLYGKKQFGEMTIDAIKEGIEKHAKRAVEIINGWAFEDVKAAYQLDAES